MEKSNPEPDFRTLLLPWAKLALRHSFSLCSHTGIFLALGLERGLAPWPFQAQARCISLVKLTLKIRATRKNRAIRQGHPLPSPTIPPKPFHILCDMLSIPTASSCGPVCRRCAEMNDSSSLALERCDELSHCLRSRDRPTV